MALKEAAGFCLLLFHSLRGFLAREHHSNSHAILDRLCEARSLARSASYTHSDYLSAAPREPDPREPEGSHATGSASARGAAFSFLKDADQAWRRYAAAEVEPCKLIDTPKKKRSLSGAPWDLK